jgi:thiol-disulfide isomerase/thioredoxin
MKNLLSLLPVLLIIISSICNAQEIALDFEATDCDGQQHHLFTELDKGKVIIVEFVMLNCSPCIVATKDLTSIIHSYEETHPDRVKIVSFGFLNNYKCDAMRAWRTTGSFTHPVFINGADQVEYYGGMGMPTFVVVGTNNHNVFFKSINGYNQSMDVDIKAAIDSALLYSPLGIEENIDANQVSIYPTVFSENFNISTNNVPESCKAVVYDITGKKQSSHLISKNGTTVIDGSNLPNGILIIRLESNAGISQGYRIIKQ